MEDITQRSDRDLLVELIGEHHTTALYTNKLRPLFCAETPPPKYAKRAQGRAHRKLMVARCLRRSLPFQQAKCCKRTAYQRQGTGNGNGGEDQIFRRVQLEPR